jgi:crotonobetainyl-CoA:carnitine CoA-transferase CaiB-like acyl-CoA transferase
MSRTKVKNPFWNTYKANDEKWFIISMARSEEIWPDLCEIIGLR